MKPFPTLPHSEILRRLEPIRKPVRVVLDTDTDNEIDDQFAVVYGWLNQPPLGLERIYAAPYWNERSSGPGDGMERSHAEILRLLERLGEPSPDWAVRGSSAYLPDPATPVDSPAARDLVQRARTASAADPLYVVAIGAITNVASALLLDPGIVEKLVVVWLGGHPLHWPDTREFNLRQDPHASRLVLDCGVPLILIPCAGVAENLRTTLPEIEAHVAPAGRIGSYLADVYRACHQDHCGYSRVIWDLSALAWLVQPEAIWTEVRPSPILTEELTWREGAGRHPIRIARSVQRDPIFRLLFEKLKDR